MVDKRADRVRAFYKALWEGKSHAWSAAPRRQRGTRTEVAGALLRPGARLLDVGCWGGEGLERMGASALFPELHGVDLIEASVQAARRRGIKAEVVDLNMRPLPYPDRFFDAVTCLAVIPQVFDPEAVVAELHRVLTPGGQLVLSVGNVAVLPNRVRLLLGRRPRTSPDPGWDGGQLHYFTLSETHRLLERHGFDVTGVHPAGRWLAARRLWLALLSSALVFDAHRRA